MLKTERMLRLILTDQNGSLSRETISVTMPSLYWKAMGLVSASSNSAASGPASGSNRESGWSFSGLVGMERSLIRPRVAVSIYKRKETYCRTERRNGFYLQDIRSRSELYCDDSANSESRVLVGGFRKTGEDLTVVQVPIFLIVEETCNENVQDPRGTNIWVSGVP
ncbi:hypothetical protein RvY_01319-2 [Ramazzottius varieornatus]|uniref:Uncharacterized protein n=1 Tax=Ramazzottius varieornatus TaxID=947166 RepID=A0A1D1UFX6_RAMVA|nr:hypothetical protein RvY_01319-2 [Ramazzottius varieornatus]